LKAVHDTLAQRHAGLIDGAVVEAPRHEGVRMLYLVVKALTRPEAMTYVAMLRIPLVAGGFVLSAQAGQAELAGAREAEVLRRRAPTLRDPLGSGALGGHGWVTDMFGEGGGEPWLPTLADDVDHDRLFPTHPLSVVRRVVAQILASLELAPLCLGDLRPLPEPGSGWI